MEIIVPAGTRPELATRAIREKHVGEIHIKGPYFCPWNDRDGVDAYGEDLYLATAIFQSERATHVPAELVVANRRHSEALGMSYDEFRGAPMRAIPDDLDEQMAHVKANPEQVRDDLADKDKITKEALDERFG